MVPYSVRYLRYRLPRYLSYLLPLSGQDTAYSGYLRMDDLSPTSSLIALSDRDLTPAPPERPPKAPALGSRKPVLARRLNSRDANNHRSSKGIGDYPPGSRVVIWIHLSLARSRNRFVSLTCDWRGSSDPSEPSRDENRSIHLPVPDDGEHDRRPGCSAHANPPGHLGTPTDGMRAALRREVLRTIISSE